MIANIMKCMPDIPEICIDVLNTNVLASPCVATSSASPMIKYSHNPKI